MPPALGVPVFPLAKNTSQTSTLPKVLLWKVLSGHRWAEKTSGEVPPTLNMYPRPRLIPTSNSGIVSYTYATDTIVGHCCHFPGTAGAVPADQEHSVSGGARSEGPWAASIIPCVYTALPCGALIKTSLKFEASLDYRGNSRTARATYGNQVSKNQNQNSLWGPGIQTKTSVVCFYCCF